jgi:hypothetical protein
MRKVMAGVLTGGALLIAGPAAAAPSTMSPACHQRPNGAKHGTLHAHETVPHGNPAHGSIPHHCETRHH